MSEKREGLWTKIRHRLVIALIRLTQPTVPEQSREGMWSIPTSFLYVYFGLMTLLCIPPLAIIISEQIAALPNESQWMKPITLIRQSATEFGPVGLGNAIVSLIIAQGGFTIMVLYYHMLNRLVTPIIRRHENRGEARGRAEGIKEGLAEANQAWREWNQRRLDHEAQGLPFDEPPPDQGYEQE